MGTAGGQFMVLLFENFYMGVYRVENCCISQRSDTGLVL